MSKIEVNTVDVQCGSTLTLGSSGKTVQLATGASQSGFGRTGTVDWQTGSIKTANFTAANGEGYFCNTTSGAFTMTLPAGSAGAIVSVQDYNNTFDTNNLIIDPNGSEKINGGDGGETLTLSTEGQGLTLVYIDSTVGWRSIHSDDFAQVPASATYITATGGTITTSGDFKIHTFTGPGTFTVCSVGNPAGSNTVDYLVVAGAGAGAGNNPSAYADGSGGGGAGGARMSSGAASGCYAASPLGACVSALPVSAQGYPITVGGGGSANSGSGTSNGGNGNNSIFSTITSAAGGGGGTHAFSSNPQKNGSDGGSGGGPGGGFTCSSSFGAGNTPPVSPPQGQNGGIANSSPDHSGAGGGGAGGAGTPGGPGCSRAGDGGIGITNAITGSNVVYAGGGGGSAGPPIGIAGGFGGINPGGSGPAPQVDRGGAGNGVTPGCGTAGTANTGGGGGAGAKGNSATSVGGAGGSGIVVIRYKFQ